MVNSVSPSLNNLNQAEQALAKSLTRLGTASRINSAKDDAAGLAIASAMTAQLGSGNQALRNVNDAQSLMETAGGALSQVGDTLQRMRELAVQAANGTNAASDRQAIQAEFSQLGESLNQISGSTQFNGQTLLDGSFSGQVQSGPEAGDNRVLSLGNVSTQGLGIDGAELGSAEGATHAIEAIDRAIASVGAQQGDVGATQASLSSTAASLAGTYENLAAARSRIADTDYGAETASLAQNSVRQQAALRAVAAYDAMQSSKLDLLK